MSFSSVVSGGGYGWLLRLVELWGFILSASAVRFHCETLLFILSLFAKKLLKLLLKFFY